MEKWKVGVIVLLIVGLGGYGFYQQNAASNPGASPAETDSTKPPPPANEKLMKLQGQTPPAWNFGESNWVNSKPITPTDTKGKVTLIEFWRIGCHHCEEAVPFMSKLFAQYSQRGVKFITIHSPGAPGPENKENNWGTVKQTIKSWNIKYPVAYDEEGALFKKTYGGDTYPTILIVDRAGKIVFAQSGHTPEKEAAIVSALDKAVKSK